MKSYESEREAELAEALRRERERSEILEQRTKALEEALRRSYAASARTGRPKDAEA